MARPIPQGSMPTWRKKRRSSIARKAWPTWGGRAITSTGSPMIAPRRAIGSPSAERMVRLGAATGPSERDSGAVNSSQRMASANSKAAILMMRLTSRTRDKGGWAGAGGSAVAAAVMAPLSACLGSHYQAAKRRSGLIRSGATPGTGQAAPVDQRLDDLRHGRRGLQAVAALAGEPEEAGRVGREAGGRDPVGGEGAKAGPAMGDAGDLDDWYNVRAGRRPRRCRNPRAARRTGRHRPRRPARPAAARPPAACRNRRRRCG